MNKYNAFIVDEFRLSILHDMIDFDTPILEENESHKLDGRLSYYFRGRKTNLFPEGRLYHVENCFKTEKQAKDKLREVVSYTLEENLILIENLENENKKLYKLMEELKHE